MTSIEKCLETYMALAAVAKPRHAHIHISIAKVLADKHTFKRIYENKIF